MVFYIFNAKFQRDLTKLQSGRCQKSSEIQPRQKIFTRKTTFCKLLPETYYKSNLKPTVLQTCPSTSQLPSWKLRSRFLNFKQQHQLMLQQIHKLSSSFLYKFKFLFMRKHKRSTTS